MISKLDGRNLYTATLSSFEVVAAALKNETDRPGAPGRSVSFFSAAATTSKLDRVAV